MRGQRNRFHIIHILVYLYVSRQNRR